MIALVQLCFVNSKQMQVNIKVGVSFSSCGKSSGGLVKRRKEVQIKGSLTANQEKLGIQFPA
jgi:hypothetical protein